MQAVNKEESFAELVRQYENMWVAIIETEGLEHIVGHGATAVDAANEAKDSGHPQAMLFKVPSFKTRFIF